MKFTKLFLLGLVFLVFFSIAVAAVGVSISPSNPTDNESLTCNIDGVSDDNRNNYRYLWYVNGAQDNGVSNTWTYPASRTDVDESITCAVFTPGNFFVGTDTVTISPNPPVNRRPTVDITSPPSSSHFDPGESISFTAVASDPDGDSLTFSWNFGDGVTSGLRNPSHAYSSVGAFTVILTVSDGSLSASDSITVIVDAPMGEDPVAVVDVSDITVCPGITVTFDASRSYDAEGAIAFYIWDFGDGESGSGSRVTHTYGAAGTYVARLTVIDYSGNEDSWASFIIVHENYCDENLPPVADAGPDVTVEAGDVVEFDGSESHDLDGSIVSYEWEFGDGDSASGVESSNVYDTTGTYTVTLTVTDDDGLTDTDTAIVTVVEATENPVAIVDVIPDTRNAFLGFPLTFAGNRSYDLDGSIVSYEWDFGDGSTASGEVVSHEFVTAGTYTVTLTVTDDDGLTGTASVVIDAGNVDRGPDHGRSRINPSRDFELRDFEISRVMPVSFRPSYNRGENVMLLVKLTNEGNFDEVVDLKIRIPEFNNYMYVVHNVYLDVSQVKWVMVPVNVPANALPGLHVATLTLTPDNRDSDVRDLTHWQFRVA